MLWFQKKNFKHIPETIMSGQPDKLLAYLEITIFFVTNPHIFFRELNNLPKISHPLVFIAQKF